MKKLSALILVLALCMGLTVPAMAADPTPETESRWQTSISTNVYTGEWGMAFRFVGDEPSHSITSVNAMVKDEVTLHYGEYKDGVFVASAPQSFDEYIVVAEDASITLQNTGMSTDSEDYGIILEVTPYVKENGEYRQRPVLILCRLGDDGGNFKTLEEFDADPDATLLYLGADGFFVFPGSALMSCAGVSDSDAYYKLAVYQVDGASLQILTRTSYLARVDSQMAAALSQQTETPAETDNPFTDVPADAYYHDAVLWAYDNGITTGATDTTFAPAATCTRGQVVTFLWRAKGCPEPAVTVNPFTDIKESDYFYKAALWAYENGITTGATDTTFDPNGTCTSAHVITFLWRANGNPAAEHTGTEYYAEAVAWANANKLLEGTATPFAPENLSPRADIMTYLYRDIVR